MMEVKKDAQIEIYRCDSSVCGKIAYLKEPNYPANDKERKGWQGFRRLTAKIRNRPKKTHCRHERCLESPSGENLWENRNIYNPEDGKLSVNM